MSGAVLALDHSVWEFEFEMNDVPHERRREVYRKLRVLEGFWIKSLSQKLKQASEPKGWVDERARRSRQASAG